MGRRKASEKPKKESVWKKKEWSKLSNVVKSSNITF